MINVLLVCQDCAGPHPSDALVMPFASAQERAEWQAQHKSGAGHERFWLLDEPLPYKQALAAYVADVALHERLRSGRPLDETPTVETVIGYLRAHAARPEWVASLQHSAVVALLDHIDALTHPHDTRGEDHDQ
jgi:hypothetical protein